MFSCYAYDETTSAADNGVMADVNHRSRVDRKAISGTQIPQIGSNYFGNTCYHFQMSYTISKLSWSDDDFYEFRIFQLRTTELLINKLLLSMRGEQSKLGAMSLRRRTLSCRQS